MSKAARVLVVEDSEDMQWVLEQTLTRMGMEVDVVASVPEALTLAQARAKPYDLVLTDGHLKGGGTGLEVTEYLRQRGQWYPAPIVMLSAEPRFEAPFLLRGGTQFVDKLNPKALSLALLALVKV